MTKKKILPAQKILHQIYESRWDKKRKFPSTTHPIKEPSPNWIIFQSEQENWQQLRYLMIEYLFRRFTGIYKREKAADTHKKPEDGKPEEETNQERKSRQTKPKERAKPTALKRSSKLSVKWIASKCRKSRRKPQNAGAPNASGGLSTETEWRSNKQSRKRRQQEQSKQQKQEENKKSAARAKPLLKTGTQKQVNPSMIAVITGATD